MNDKWKSSMECSSIDLTEKHGRNHTLWCPSLWAIDIYESVAAGREYTSKIIMSSPNRKISVAAEVKAPWNTAWGLSA